VDWVDLLGHTSSYTSNPLVPWFIEEDSETYTAILLVKKRIDEARGLTSSYSLASNKDTSALILRTGERRAYTKHICSLADCQLWTSLCIDVTD
jgi:hypothetical protein